MYLTTDMETTLVESLSCECFGTGTGNVVGASNWYLQLSILTSSKSNSNCRNSYFQGLPPVRKQRL